MREDGLKCFVSQQVILDDDRHQLTMFPTADDSTLTRTYLMNKVVLFVSCTGRAE